MDTHIAAHSTIGPEAAVLHARLPGEAEDLVPSREGGGPPDPPGPPAFPAIESGERPAMSGAPSSSPTRRRHGLLLGAVALAAAGGSFFLVSPYNHVYPVPRVASAVRNAAESAGIKIPPGIVAPSATLASVSVPPSPPVVRDAYSPSPKAQEMRELLSLHAGEPGAAGAAPAAPVPRPPVVAVDPAPARGLRQASSGPPPGYVPSEPGSQIPAPPEPPTTASARPNDTLDAVAVAPTQGDTRDASQAASPPRAASVAGPPDVTATILSSLRPQVPPAAPGGPSTARQASTPAPAAGAVPVATTAPARPPARPGETPRDTTVDPVTVARELHAAPMTPQDQVDVLGMVTEMATIVHDLRIQNGQLRDDIRKSTADSAARLGDLERRLAMTEARTAISAARDAGDTPPSPFPIVAPAPVPARAIPVALTSADAALPSSGSTVAKRYKVQAASPGLAMLAEVDRGGGDGAQVEVRVGDSIPGYGRVKSIGQKGSSWVVSTEHGDIS